MTHVSLLALLLGCPAGKDSGTDTSGVETGSPVDRDGDGYAGAADCDDADVAIHPGADETCDEVDQDCDGLVDENPIDGRRYYYDGDGDDYGDPDTRVVACGYGDGVAG